METMTGIYVALGIALLLVLRKLKKKVTRTVLTIIILAVALYSGAVTIDLSRMNSLNEPVFAQETEPGVFKGLVHTVTFELDGNGNFIAGSLSLFGIDIEHIIQ